MFLSDYDEACESHMGWCTECEEFTTCCCEPDAHEYMCDKCGQQTVFGAEEALLTGIFEFEPEG